MYITPAQLIRNLLWSLSALSGILVLFWNAQVLPPFQQQQHQQPQQQPQQQHNDDDHQPVVLHSFGPRETSRDNNATATITTTTNRPSNHHASCNNNNNNNKNHGNYYNNNNNILHIASGDAGAGAGAVFFQYVVAQLLYAERYNLTPWVYLNNYSSYIYDVNVHGNTSNHHQYKTNNDGVSFVAMTGRNVTSERRRFLVPTAPDRTAPLKVTTYHVAGDGVWEHYLEPVSDFSPHNNNNHNHHHHDDHDNKSCQNKNQPPPPPILYTIPPEWLYPGLHSAIPWTPKCWRYFTVSERVAQPHLTYHEWLEPQRKRAHHVVQRYYRFRPHLLEAAERANPNCSSTMMNQSSSSSWCLGVHIRHSDKAAGRRKIGVEEFLPYVLAFVNNGGQYVYVATDSSAALRHIHQEWPTSIARRIRTLGPHIVRSDNDHQAVFELDGVSRHETNREILTEILALSKCQFLLHGFSAVSEASVWINLDQHEQSVNLEDPDRLSESEFGRMVEMVLNNNNNNKKNESQAIRDDPKLLPNQRLHVDWWKAAAEPPPPTGEGSTTRGRRQRAPTHEACRGVDGILHIATVGHEATTTTARAFFESVLHQLRHAERHNLKPWIHLDHRSTLIYDVRFHGSNSNNHDNNSAVFPTTQVSPNNEDAAAAAEQILQVQGNGVWESYFEPVSDFVPGDRSCRDKPMVSLTKEEGEMQASLGLKDKNASLERMGNPWKQQSNDTLKEALVKKYFRFRPHILQRAEEVNPNSTWPCVAIQVDSIFTNGEYRPRVKPEEFLPYITKFQQAGYKSAYLSTDTNIVYNYLTSRFRRFVTSQGPHVVRGSKKLSVADKEEPHRVNAETLVDILAMSKCSFLLHGSSPTAEATKYLNPRLRENSLNLEMTAT